MLTDSGNLNNDTHSIRSVLKCAKATLRRLDTLTHFLLNETWARFYKSIALLLV